MTTAQIREAELRKRLYLFPSLARPKAHRFSEALCVCIGLVMFGLSALWSWHDDRVRRQSPSKPARLQSADMTDSPSAQPIARHKQPMASTKDRRIKRKGR